MPALMTPAQRVDAFWAKVDQSGECWEWTAARNRSGYGRCGWHGHPMLAHRWAYELTYGQIPAGRLVCHRCDNPPCVRPDHLFLGSPRDNAADAVAKNRLPAGERSPRAKLSNESVREIRSLQGRLPQKEVAARFGVHKSIIYGIWKGRRWGTVA